MRVALAPVNPTIADLSGNSRRILDAAQAAEREGADLVLFPELALTGYPPRDLLLRDDFLSHVEAALDALARELPDLPVLLGAPTRAEARPNAPLFNSLYLYERGRVAHRYDKRLLPAYDVFDERRYFLPGTSPPVVEILGRRVGLAICEDLWKAADVPGARGYPDQPDPLAELERARPDFTLVASASPFVLGKDARQQEILLAAAHRTSAPVLSVNQLGANDELIFDGAAHAAFPTGPEPRCLSAPRFREGLHLVDLSSAERPRWTASQESDADKALWEALTLALRDYARKTGFAGAILGLSGGIDSSIVAALAARALGPENVVALAMPSRFSSEGSLADARAQARSTRVRLLEIPIETMHRAAESSLEPAFAELGADPKDFGLAEENVQSRLRGLTVMAVSNKLNLLPLATGNKSEMAVGYCTLYGDMNGGVAPIADLYKTRVYQLARWLNKNHEAAGFPEPPIPPDVIAKPPSAELKPDQRDQDTLPPYETLDAILEAVIDRRASIAEAAARAGCEPALVSRVAAMLSRAEYKRRQMTIGFKLSPQAFGIGRRLPVAKSAETRPATALRATAS